MVTDLDRWKQESSNLAANNESSHWPRIFDVALFRVHMHVYSDNECMPGIALCFWSAIKQHISHGWPFIKYIQVRPCQM